jgi:hypothetical protein
MSTENANKMLEVSVEDLARLGGGALSYIREIEGTEARRLMGPGVTVEPTARLFCLYNADGTPISISGTREGAIGSAFEHELMPMNVH